MFATFSCIADTEASAEQILYSADKGDTVAHWASIYVHFTYLSNSVCNTTGTDNLIEYAET